MSQKERDRLKVLHEVSQGQITQKQAAAQLKLSERQVRRLLKKFKSCGDGAVIHGLRGRASNGRIDEAIEGRAKQELLGREYRDFGPTFAAEQLRKRLGIAVGKDTVRKWMTAAGVWEPRRRTVERIHQWRPRRACAGELVQWDTSEHDWLEGRGECRYLVAMIDDATSRVYARFVERDTAEQNLRVLWGYVERFGRPLAFYTDKAAMFETTAKRTALEQDEAADSSSKPTQITRALAELGIDRISAHSPQAKGRIERFFNTAQDRLIKELRLAGVTTMEAANEYLARTFLPDWEQRFTVAPANPTDVHRPVTELHNLAASLSRVQNRTISNGYTFPLDGAKYRILPTSIRPGMKRQTVRVEARLDGTVAARYQGVYLDIAPCTSSDAEPERELVSPAKHTRKDHNRGGRSRWMQDFSVANSRKTVWQAMRDSNRNG